MGSKLHWPVQPIQPIIPFPVVNLWPNRVVIMSRLVIIAFIAKLTVPIHWSAVTVTAIRVTIVSSDIFVNIQLEVSYHRYLRIA